MRPALRPTVRQVERHGVSLTNFVMERAAVDVRLGQDFTFTFFLHPDIMAENQIVSAVAALPLKGEAGENPAQSYLYCKRGRRRKDHWPTTGLRRCAGGRSVSQETRCRDTEQRSSEVERCSIF